MSNVLFSLTGRVPRKTYWLFLIGVVIVMIVAGVIDEVVAEDETSLPILSLICSLAIIWPSIAVGAKRWHDRDKSGWWVLIALVPLIGPIWAIVENGFLAGTAGDNRFGPAPAP